MKFKARWMRLDRRTRSVMMQTSILCAIGVAYASYAFFVQHDLYGVLAGFTTELVGCAYFGGWIDSRRAIHDDIEERDK